MVEGRTAVSGVTPKGCELIADLGEGMKLYKVEIDSLVEQDINARMLPSAEHSQLVNNIRKRGQLESVPYCAIVNGRVEIVSGHHRVRAAREAGLKTCSVMVDESGLQRSEIVAKQLAHNRISGYDDPETLRKLFDMLDNPDLILESGLAGDMGMELDLPMERGITPSLPVEWRTMTVTFLPHQMENFQELIEAIPPSDMVGAANVVQFSGFMEAALQYGRLRNIRNLGTVIALLTETAVLENARIIAESGVGTAAEEEASA